MDLNRENKYYIFIKALVYLVIFSFLHFAYDISQENIVVGIFSGTDESVFQHMKIGFYSYLILTVIEYLIFMKQINKGGMDKFLYSRLLSAILLSWFMIVLYLIAALFFQEQPPLEFEIFYSIIMGYISILPVLMLEIWYEKFEFPKQIKYLIIFFVILLVLEFTLFTFNKPWHDIFLEP
ncbi:MAG: hypothetical protein JW891_08750 [Candidatus Lokiarchaeota archaeon]|nr:hypothetical protein [Candidatus Lokiarchaeota archaeon]